ncbi:MAG: hypothetical protein U0521_01515 [Anaerolineae bacterium]
MAAGRRGAGGAPGGAGAGRAFCSSLWTLPFFAAWWLFVSYDPRFLLLFLPPLAVLAGDLLVRLWVWLGPVWQPRAHRGDPAGAGAGCPGVFNAVEYKVALVRNR